MSYGEKITTQVGSHAAQPWKPPTVTSEADHLKKSCADKCEDYQSMIQSYMDGIESKTKWHISASSNGFVQACVAAYSDGHHLSLSPDDVWLAILSQLSFYVNANVEHLIMRRAVLAHERRPKIDVVLEQLRVEDPPYQGSGQLARQKLAKYMTRQARGTIMHYDEIGDARDLVAADFTTTWFDERIVASVIWLGAPPPSFSLRYATNHGLLSVTLRGQRKDWEDICSRVYENVSAYGDEPSEFARLLEPILHFFSKTFDKPNSPDVRSFWSRMVRHEDFGSQGTYLSGWITAFCFWDGQGNPLQHRIEMPKDACDLGGVRYHRVDKEEIPGGYASLPVTMKNNDGTEFQAKMVAGSIGVKAPDKMMNCIEPQLGWWLFKVNDSER